MNILDILSEIHIKISPLEKKNFNEATRKSLVKYMVQIIFI